MGNFWRKLLSFQRSALGPNVTKITLESFLAWKKRKRQEKIDKLEQDMERRKADFKAGKALVVCCKFSLIIFSFNNLSCCEWEVMG